MSILFDVMSSSGTIWKRNFNLNLQKSRFKNYNTNIPKRNTVSHQILKLWATNRQCLSALDDLRMKLNIRHVVP